MNKSGIVLGLGIIAFGLIAGIVEPKIFPLNVLITFFGGFIAGGSI